MQSEERVEESNNHNNQKNENEEIEGEGLLKNSCNTSKREWKEGKIFLLWN